MNDYWTTGDGLQWTNEGGWPASDMRTWLQESILPLFPENLRSNITEVKKYSYSYSDNGTISSEDTIWIPSVREVFGEDDRSEDDGPEYLTAYTGYESRRKRRIANSEIKRWWLRSTSDNGDGTFRYVFDSGTGWGYEGACYNIGVVIGFCL